jgi:CBS domain-containing protein
MAGTRFERFETVLKQQARAMRAKDLMQREVATVRTDVPLAELADMLQQAHIHGAPVVADDGVLVGFVSQEDVLFGTMTGPPDPPEGDRHIPRTDEFVTRVGDIMTAPAVTATEETDVRDLCRLMWRLRLHHIPIVRDDKVMGIVSSLDLCRVIADGGVEV